jgi:ABC-type sugar transport system ATPase subunit
MFSETTNLEVPPKERDIGFVFQNYALYPHMSVFKNVAFGLKVRKYDKRVIEERVQKALETVELTEFSNRRPKQLSGGQQQRVAVARTLAMRPSFLLFDEPLANLDPVLRVSLRSQLKQIHHSVGTTSIYVTHDQSEAMVLGDRIAVMQNGQIAQLDTGDRLYRFPANTFVAAFTGMPKSNFIPGEIHRTEDRVLLVPQDDPYCFVRLPDECAEFAGQHVVTHVRPEDLEIQPRSSEDEGVVTVLAVMPEGSDTLVHLQLGEMKEHLIAYCRNDEATRFRRGDPVHIRFRRGNLYDPQSEQLIGAFGYDPQEVPAWIRTSRLQVH